MVLFKVNTKYLYVTEPEVKLKILVNKMRAQLKRAEKRVVVLEGKIDVAREAFMRALECVAVVKGEVEEIKKTCNSVAMEVHAIEQRRTMEESLNEDFPIDELESEVERREDHEAVEGEEKAEATERSDIEVCAGEERGETAGGEEIEPAGKEAAPAEKDEEMEERKPKDEEDRESKDTEMVEHDTVLWA